MLELKEMFENFEEIKKDDCIGYKRYGKTNIYCSSIIKYCTCPYCILINLTNYNIIGIIDLNNKSIIRLESNKHFTDLAKLTRCTLTKIQHCF